MTTLEVDKPATSEADATSAMLAKAFRSFKMIEVSLDDLVLDPNNPRLRKADVIRRTSMSYFSTPAVQAETEDSMWNSNGRTTTGIYRRLTEEGLVQSLCGFHVAMLPDGKFLLCDGNTRVTAMRKIIRDINNGNVLVPENIQDTWKKIKVYLMGKYSEERQFQMVWAAIRSKLHVVGNKDWGAYQKAAFVASLRDSGMNMGQIGAIMGTKNGTVKSISDVKEMIEAYDLFQKAKRDVQHGDRVTEKKFNYFYEVVRSSASKRFLLIDKSTHDPALREKRFQVFLNVLDPLRGEKSFFSGNVGLVRMRALKDDPRLWESALDMKKNGKFLKKLTEVESNRNINDIAEKFFFNIRDIKADSISDVNVNILKQIMGACDKVIAMHAKLA